MKQAYTNTIRGGGGRPLTIATGSKRGGGGRRQPPKCAYGSACTRRGCAYWHPPASAAPYENYHEDPRSKICKPFLAGMCTYGQRCMNRHPAKEEAEAVRAAYKRRACSHGDSCRTEGCLYWHPWEDAGEGEAVEDSEFAGDICTVVRELRLDDATDASGVVPTYEQWLALNCPSPVTDENYVYNMWHYSGSGMQRGPWEVYCLMYPQSLNNGTNMSATSQAWGHVAMNSNIRPPPQSWEPAAGASQKQREEDPKTFQEWKRKGQPYPSWFCSDLDPWYDDEGVRLSLEEVYEVLYGENAQENFAQKQQAHQIANNPTPAELAALLSTNESQLLGTSPATQYMASKGGWASVAAKRPAPIPKSSSSNINSDGVNGAHGGSQGIAPGDSYAGNDQKGQTVVIPSEVWLPSTANSDCFHLYPNPIERFKAVNEHHRSYLASVTIPRCFEGPSLTRKGGRVALLDVHFQSARTIAPVLDRFLHPALRRNDEVWVVTGSGHHVATGHQRREGGGVLFNAVKRYLEERKGDTALEFRVGKDTSGGKNRSSGGAFLVRRRPS